MLSGIKVLYCYYAKIKIRSGLHYSQQIAIRHQLHLTQCWICLYFRNKACILLAVRQWMFFLLDYCDLIYRNTSSYCEHMLSHGAFKFIINCTINGHWIPKSVAVYFYAVWIWFWLPFFGQVEVRSCNRHLNLNGNKLIK